MRVLVTGWFSFAEMGATAGDLLARDLVCGWLREAEVPFDMAIAPPFSGGVSLSSVNPSVYSHILFVCGPFGNGPPITEFLARFRHCRMLGINLSMLQDLDEWNPFELLLERDSSRSSRPDLVFLADRVTVPVVGVVLVHPQKEYGFRSLHQRANAAIQHLLEGRSISRVGIDTQLDTNSTGLRSTAEVESLVARMDVVVTTRLHGLVLGIRNDVPVVAIDPIEGGAKVYRQAQSIEWPAVLKVEDVTDARLAETFEYCLTTEARTRVSSSRALAVARLAGTRHALITTIGTEHNA